MNISRSGWLKKWYGGPWTGLPFLLFLLFANVAKAEVHNIEATFQPDPSHPQKNQFKNQTPSEGFCQQIPQACEPSGLFSLIARIPFTANAPILANHVDPRLGGMAKVPSDWRDVVVTHASGDTSKVQIRIAGIGHETAFPLSVGEMTGGGGWDDLWEGGGWLIAPAPCQGVGWASAGPHGYNSFWKVPEGAGVCSKKAKFDIPLAMRYQYFVYAYELRTPDPLKMVAGEYTGTIIYTVGPGQDFDMGDVMIPSDSLLTLNFLLGVTHTLKVDLPPGGNRVILEPQGGWHRWLLQNRKPVRLYRDQTFNISASSRFTMKLECGVDLEPGCGIRDSTGRYAAVVDVSVSLPDGLTDDSGQPVRRMPLSRSVTPAFQPGIYVDRKPGTLHFEINQRYTEWLIDAQRQHYQGNITVIWDSQV